MSPRFVRLAAALALTAALCACHARETRKPPQDNIAAATEPGMTKGVDRSHKGTAAPDAAIVDGDGEQTSLTEIADRKPLLVNLWASWCAPCVKELPTLDTLSQSPGETVKVAAISQDMGPHPSVEAFLSGHKITNLEAYQDKGMALSGALNAQVLPTSVLYDAHGKEVWRYVGDLDWTSPEAAKLLGEAQAGPAARS